MPVVISGEVLPCDDKKSNADCRAVASEEEKDGKWGGARVRSENMCFFSIEEDVMWGTKSREVVEEEAREC
jgi:hypothetical protein